MLPRPVFFSCPSEEFQFLFQFWRHISLKSGSSLWSMAGHYDAHSKNQLPTDKPSVSVLSACLFFISSRPPEIRAWYYRNESNLHPSTSTVQAEGEADQLPLFRTKFKGRGWECWITCFQILSVFSVFLLVTVSGTSAIKTDHANLFGHQSDVARTL